MGWFFTLLLFFCNIPPPFWRSCASMSRVYYLCFLGKPNIWEQIRFCCKVREAVSPSSFHCPRSVACDLRNIAVNGYSMRAKSVTDSQNSLQKHMNERSSVGVVSTFKSCKSSVVRSATSRRPEWISWPRHVVLSVNYAHFFNFQVRPAFIRSLRTSLVWLTCLRGVCEKITNLSR